MGSCFTCLKSPSSSSSLNDTNQTTAHVLSNQPISEKISHGEHKIIKAQNL